VGWPFGPIDSHSQGSTSASAKDHLALAWGVRGGHSDKGTRRPRSFLRPLTQQNNCLRLAHPQLLGLPLSSFFPSTLQYATQIPLQPSPPLTACSSLEAPRLA
jgi:hypothetical protein